LSEQDAGRSCSPASAARGGSRPSRRLRRDPACTAPQVAAGAAAGRPATVGPDPASHSATCRRWGQRPGIGGRLRHARTISRRRHPDPRLRATVASQPATGAVPRTRFCIRRGAPVYGLSSPSTSSRLRRSWHSRIWNVRSQHDAAVDGLTMTYSSGVVEGHVNRIKMIKLQIGGTERPRGRGRLPTMSKGPRTPRWEAAGGSATPQRDRGRGRMLSRSARRPHSICCSSSRPNL
jgi:hypothetical protein